MTPAPQQRTIRERMQALGIDSGPNGIDADVCVLLDHCERAESEAKRITNEAIEVTHDVSARLTSTELAIKSLIDAAHDLLYYGEAPDVAKIAWLKTMFAAAKREFDARATEAP